jgi:hypothetical protein
MRRAVLGRCARRNVGCRAGYRGALWGPFFRGKVVKLNFRSIQDSERVRVIIRITTFFKRKASVWWGGCQALRWYGAPVKF